MVLGGAPESDPGEPQAVGVARVGLPCSGVSRAGQLLGGHHPCLNAFLSRPRPRSSLRWDGTCASPHLALVSLVGVTAGLGEDSDPRPCIFLLRNLNLAWELQGSTLTSLPCSGPGVTTPGSRLLFSIWAGSGAQLFDQAPV